jgi:hypothetical protein
LQKLFAHEHRQDSPDEKLQRVMRMLAAQECELAIHSEQIAALIRRRDELRHTMPGTMLKQE